MKSIGTKKARYWIAAVVIGMAVGLTIQFVRAWTDPAGTPPNGNVGAPINTGSLPQTKEGGLLLGGSTPGGNKGAGSINANSVCIKGVCQSTWPASSLASYTCACMTYYQGNGSGQQITTYKNCGGGWNTNGSLRINFGGGSSGWGSSGMYPCY